MRLRRGEWELLVVVVDVDVDDDVVNNNMMNDTTLHDVYEQEKKKRRVGKEVELEDSPQKRMKRRQNKVLVLIVPSIPCH